MTPSLLFTLSLSTTFVSSVALSSFLIARARAAPGAKQLAAFVVIVGLFALGLVLPERFGMASMALAPLGSAMAVDFAIRLTGQGAGALPIVHALGAGATLLLLLFGPGVFFETSDGSRGFRYEGAGLFGVAVAIGLAAYGNGLMAFALRRAEGKRRREIAIVLVSSLVGLSTVVSFAPPLFGMAVAPWSILALPIYPALLVYGILRYELMAANVWARRAAAYALILLLAAAVAGLLAAAPLSFVAPSMDFASLWLVVATAMALAFAFGEPIRRAADRLVYAGPEISAEMIAQWRGDLAGADTTAEAIEIARTHLCGAMRPSVDVTLCSEGPEPALRCADDGGKWVATLAGFEDSPPGARRLAIVYADVLMQSLDDIDRRRRRAESERLAELGMLASTIAHDLRNPLNIVNMAAAAAPAETRAEIIEQTRRMNRLVAELLDYAKPWKLEPADIDFTAAFGDVETRIAGDAHLCADPFRFAQAMDNLIANARAAGGRVAIFVETAQDETLIHVCDDGPGVPEEIKDRLFQPFVSRSSEGTGLGLAIVAKIMAAHGGSVSLGAREGFSTCVTLRFPA
ncbi:HAMP domain-containing sensor histidine kinase [Methylosinus sp. Sm6]|uniref:sensor histidine kinase n=1 Tax=Methylosinus sp. Sm6 TaxID=2866948 RepID=UPI001C99E036|nr:HAMP domain-containing sensor histidine kinase [Methylosinus sp. Sm6]MBY6243755.1 HAMP domain-containing histidine kinase [Methylosinus sp. Sm6]